MKVLEFRLPTGAAGMAAGMAKMGINKQLRALADQHGISYTGYTVKYHYYVEIPDKDYTLVALVWNRDQHPHRNYRLVEGVPLGARKG